MKTARYYLEVDGYESTMIKDMEITKANFENQMKVLNKAVEETKEYEIPTEFTYFEYEYKTHIRKVWRYRSGCCEVFLIKNECKEGYCYRNKK